MGTKELAFLMFNAANWYEQERKGKDRKTQKEYATTCAQLRESANRVLNDEFKITVLNILDKNLAIELAQLQMDALLAETTDINFGIGPEFSHHVFIVGSRLLVVTGEDPIDNAYCYYLWDLYHDLSDYLSTYVGQEPLRAAAERIAEPLFGELAENLEIED